MRGKGVLIELVPHIDSFKRAKAKKLGKIICQRIGSIRPYLEKIADFMYESEKLSRLRTEVNVFLYDEQTEFDKYGHTWKQGVSFKADPLSGYFLLLSFGDMRGPKSGPKLPGKRRYLIISLHDDVNSLPIGYLYMNMKNYAVGT